MTPSLPPKDQKYRNLLCELRSMQKVVVAFSGGLDSTFLLHAARQALADDVLAVTIAADYTPESEVEEAKRTAQAVNVRHRDLSREHGLVWDKPSGACLLSRIPHDTRIESVELRRIDQAEALLKNLGLTAVRLRSHGDLARIEVPHDRVAGMVEADRRHGIDARLKALGYRYVTVDLAGYRMGSLNEKTA
ncbi:asparagine synthase-related protein [Desulfovibrio sp. TomC]|uniref:asparagine synthase-related protein n=1 Tax=Desulfovibrio sp. TomC TaxID=1562888 RepID=UPI0005BE9C20|nr:asparagine synthase-related protein [Desulfovibrio sp. TomC]